MKPEPRYCIIANPASGSLRGMQGHGRLQAAARVLCAPIVGLDTGSAEEMAQCARDQANRCDVLVVAGGDGTFSLVLNAVDLASTVLAFLPFGTGNALTHTLGYAGSPADIAARIRRGRIHDLDLIDCDGRRKAFMASLGIDGTAIRLYEAYRSKGYRGLDAHVRAGLSACFRHFRPTDGCLITDGASRRIRRLASFMVVKQPYFGMGLKAVPAARWDDGYLHTRAISSGLPGLAAALVTGFTVGNRVGDYRRTKSAVLQLDAPLVLQIDGEVGWTADRFAFTVMPGVLRLKH